MTQTDRQTLKPHEPQLGTVLSKKYQLLSVIGRGGFGIVYGALRLDIQRQVALKVLLPAWIHQDPELAIRFRRESLLASRLRHPNTITLYDHGQTDTGILYMAMEFVDGKTLSSILREESPIAPKRLVHFFRQILGSLSEAHNQGIVHRDLKPSNIMISSGLDGQEFLKVLDFGVAKALSPNLLTGTDMAQTLTQAGRFCGTPRYMAPEQFRGGPVSPSCDLYALGLIGYELLTGRPAIKGRTMVDIIVSQVTEPALIIPPEPEVRIPGALREILNTALKKVPAERYATTESLLSDLEHWNADQLVKKELEREDDSTIKIRREALAKAKLLAAQANADAIATPKSRPARVEKVEEEEIEEDLDIGSLDEAMHGEQEAKTTQWTPNRSASLKTTPAPKIPLNPILNRLKDIPQSEGRDTLRSPTTPSLAQITPSELTARPPQPEPQKPRQPSKPHQSEFASLVANIAPRRPTRTADYNPYSEDTGIDDTETYERTAFTNDVESPWPGVSLFQSTDDDDAPLPELAPDPRESPLVPPPLGLVPGLDSDTTVDISSSGEFLNRLAQDRARRQNHATHNPPPPRKQQPPKPRPLARPVQTDPVKVPRNPLVYIAAAIVALVVVGIGVFGLWTVLT